MPICNISIEIIIQGGNVREDKQQGKVRVRKPSLAPTVPHPSLAAQAGCGVEDGWADRAVTANAPSLLRLFPRQSQNWSGHLPGARTLLKATGVLRGEGVLPFSQGWQEGHQEPPTSKGPRQVCHGGARCCLPQRTCTREARKDWLLEEVDLKPTQPCPSVSAVRPFPA